MCWLLYRLVGVLCPLFGLFLCILQVHSTVGDPGFTVDFLRPRRGRRVTPVRRPRQRCRRGTVPSGSLGDIGFLGWVPLVVIAGTE